MKKTLIVASVAAVFLGIGWVALQTLPGVGTRS